MRLFFDMNKKSLPQIVKQNKEDIKELKEKIKPFYKTEVDLQDDATTINVSETNIDVDTYSNGFLLTQQGKLFDIIAVNDGVVYISFMADFKTIQNYLKTFDFDTNTDGAVYSDNTITLIGKIVYNWGTEDTNETKRIDATINIPITGTEDIIVDANEDGSAIELHLDNDIKNRVAKSLVTPVSAPQSTEIVGINNANAQVNIGIGEGLELDNGVLKATGGSGGGGGIIVETFTNSQAQALYNKINSLADKNKLLKLVVKNTSASNITIPTTTLTLNTTGGQTGQGTAVMFEAGASVGYNLVFHKNSQEQFTFSNIDQVNTNRRFNLYNDGFFESYGLTKFTKSGASISSENGQESWKNPSSMTLEFKLYYFE